MLPVLFVAEKLVDTDILCGMEDVALDHRIGFLQLRDDALGFHSLVPGAGCVGRLRRHGTGGAGICEVTSALDEVKMILIAPCLDVVFTDKIERADQLHSVKICALQSGEHGLPLPGVQHSHKGGLNDIVIVVSERNFVAAELLRLLI